MGRRISTALLVCGALLCASDSSQADPTDTIKAMLDHTAIVGEMVRACGHARPELADRFATANSGWWERNRAVTAMLGELRRGADTAQNQMLLRYYEELKARLHDQIASLDDAGQTTYADNCDGVLNQLEHGSLDYAPDEGA